MDLSAASTVILRTHTAAIAHNTRANALLLESGSGVGKSDTVFQTTAKLAKALNKPCGLVQFMMATIASVDVRGFMLPVKGTGANASLDTIFSTPPWYPVKANTWVYEPTPSGRLEDNQPATKEDNSGKWHKPGTWTGDMPEYGIMFLDEFGQAEDDVKKCAAELIYKGAVGTTELPVGWRVIAAQNRLSDRSGVLRELMFLVNRRCRLSIDASLPAWLEWANHQPLHVQPHYLTMSFAQQNPDIVFRDTVPDGSDPFCTPRTLCLMDWDLKALRSEEDISKNSLPMDDISREVMAGWIGGPAAAQYMTHLKYVDQLPTIEQIERDPDKAKLPEKRDAQMVAAYMLAHGVSEKNAKKILTYLFRLNIEMQVLCISTICTTDSRAKVILSEPDYIKWLTKNKDLLVASRS